MGGIGGSIGGAVSGLGASIGGLMTSIGASVGDALAQAANTVTSSVPMMIAGAVVIVGIGWLTLRH